MIKVIEKSKNIKDLLVIQPEIFYDYRGENTETFNKEDWKRILKENGIKEFEFVVDSVSVSKENTLRGFHGDTIIWKLIQCLKGAIYFVVIDVRKDSPTFNNYETFNLNDKNRWQVLIPAGCVNAHLCISDLCIFHYKQSHCYVKQSDQIHIRWNDPTFNIFWPISDPILSERDSNY